MAAISEVLIANMALHRLGVSKSIAALSESSEEAQQANFWYEICRDRLLEEFVWPFATKYAALGKVADNPNDDWAYSYRYPSDCIRCQRIENASRMPIQSPPFEIGFDGTGRLIFCDEEAPTLRYTAKVTNVALFPWHFADALGWLMAIEMAMPLSVRQDIRREASVGFREAMSSATASSLNEQGQDSPRISVYQNARL